MEYNNLCQLPDQYWRSLLRRNYRSTEVIKSKPKMSAFGLSALDFH